MLSENDNASISVRYQNGIAHDGRGPLEVSAEPLMTLALDGAITGVNEPMLRLTGVSRENFTKSNFSAWFTQPERASELCPLAVATGFVSGYPLTFRGENSRLESLLFNAAVYNSPDGTPFGVFLAASEVSARPVEQQFKTFFELAPDAMLVVSGDGSILQMNAQTERLFGYPRAELVGKPLDILLPARFREVHAGHRSEFFREPLYRPMGEALDLWGLRKDGTEFPIEISLGPIDAPDGLTVGATIRDVTARRLASQHARGLLEASLDPIVTINVEGKITDVNEATIAVTGIAREQLVGTEFAACFTEPDQAREGYGQAFAMGRVTDYPLTIRHRNGRLTDVLYNASVYRDADQNVLGVFAAARDVTESQRVMREFAETKTLLDNIFQSSTRYSIIGKDLEHRIVSWNEGARRNYRYEAEEVMGRSAQILHTPEDMRTGAVKQLLNTAFDTGVAEGEFERVRKDGTRFWANVVVTRRNDSDGNPIGFLLMSSDISERKQAEEQARTTSLYARSLIEATLDPLVTISPEGKITDANEATSEVTGVPRDKLVGTDFSDYFTTPERAREGYQQIFAKGSVTGFPLTIRHRNHSLTEVMYNASVYKDTFGKVLGVFAVARDITAQRRAESEIAAQRGKELERLAELERFQKLTVGRELKMIELKKEIQELKQRIPASPIE